MLLLFILIPVLAIQAYIYYDDYQARRALEFQANLEVARAVARTFESFVQDVILHELVIGLAITSSQPMASEDITRLLISSPSNVAVRDFTWLNPKGNAIYSGNPAVVGNSYSDRSFFRDVANGREWAVGELVISRATGKSIFGVSRGIRDEKGSLLGVVVAIIIPENLDARLAVERGKGGGHTLVDSKGMLVYRYPAINPTWEERNWLKQYPEFEEVLKGQEITKTVYAAYEKKNRLVSFTPVSFIGWAATAGKPEEDVVRPILTSMVKSALLFLSVSFVAFFIALAVSRKIASPVTELSAHALALGHGEKPGQVTFNDISEFQNLAESFNAMAEKVQTRETALRESEKRWSVTLASIGDAVIATDMGGRITFLNKVAELLTGWSMADAAGKPVQEVFRIVNEHTRAIVEDPVSKVIQTGMIVGLANHTMLLRKGGGEMPIDDSGAPIRDDDGCILGVVLVFRDITERKQVEVSLQESERRYSDMLRRVELVSVTLDRDAKITFCNDYLLRLTGWRREEVLGSNWFERFIPPENDELKGTLEELLNDLPSAWHHENEILTRSGERRLIRWNNSVLHSNSGEVIGTASIGEDITDRKHAERKLAETSQRLRALMEAVPVGISFSNDATCQSISGNPAVLAQFEVATVDNLSASAPDAAAPGRQVRFFRDGREITDAELPLQRAVRENAVIPPMELEVRLPGGRLWFTEASGAPVHDEQGHVIGGLAVTVDITERKRAEDALRQTNLYLEQRVQERTAELKERADQLGRLSSQLTMVEQRERKRLAQILHDGLQQYLVAAKMQVGGLIEQAPDAALKQAATEVEDLLSESVKVSRSLAAELSPPILQEAGLLAGLEWLSRWKYDKHGLKVQLTMQMDAPVLTEDVKVLLFESIRELLLNVVKHAKTDSARVSLFQQDERSLQIIVSDNGVGFDPASVGANCENFGLFSIRERLSLIGGRLEVDSSPGKGARFTLTAPLTIKKPIESMPCAQPDKIDLINVDPLIKSDGKIRILLTDDHAVMREGLARLLGQESDFDIVGQASNGQEAVEMAGALLPDVILMDISMPGMNGIDATQVIHQRHPDIRIIGLSLYQEEERAKAMLDSGAVFYLTKSGPPADLRAAIRSCIKEKSGAGTENAESPPLKI